MSETVRTFIAIEMPPEVREYLDRCQDRLRRAGGKVRWVRTDLIHLTLVFLGEVAVEQLDALGAAVEGAVAGVSPLALRAAGAGQFPPRGRPRVIWIGFDEPTGALLALQKAVADATVPFAEKVETRPYRPHLTLGRVRTGGDLHRLSAAVADMADRQGPQFDADEIVVMQSTLSPQGPTYSPLSRVRLVGAGN